MEEQVLEYEGYTIKIERDGNVESPRTWSNIGRLITFHRNYKIGDEHSLSIEEAKELEQAEDVISLPVYLYDHGNLCIQTEPFDCRWDGGKLGFIYASHKDIKKEYGWKTLTKRRREQVEKLLQDEVKIMDQYLQGDVYGYTIEDKEGEFIDSCWGYYGDDALEEAKRVVDYHVQKALREAGPIFYGA